MRFWELFKVLSEHSFSWIEKEKHKPKNYLQCRWEGEKGTICTTRTKKENLVVWGKKGGGSYLSSVGAKNNCKHSTHTQTQTIVNCVREVREHWIECGHTMPIMQCAARNKVRQLPKVHFVCSLTNIPLLLFLSISLSHSLNSWRSFKFSSSGICSKQFIRMQQHNIEQTYRSAPSAPAPPQNAFAYIFCDIITYTKREHTCYFN